jgi:hypothetical protein
MAVDGTPNEPPYELTLWGDLRLVDLEKGTILAFKKVDHKNKSESFISSYCRVFTQHPVNRWIWCGSASSMAVNPRLDPGLTEPIVAAVWE